MKLKEGFTELIHAEGFSIEEKYRMTIEHKGETFYWIGFIGKYGSVEDWYNANEERIICPDWAEDLDTFELCIEKENEDKKRSGRTDCGYEVEQAIIKELLLQGFPLDLTREVLRTYPIDDIIFEQIMKTASIQIDELQKAEVK